ncbi:low choriolytic enzyme-like [Kryptolebias marmoratus]|uniref:low choriolytic enzyme-like n=1 Tax=Kryptolebias marmoratus TaxID=37003 RepID=UPI0018AD0964|nr:low choriolytic enzyme-like [Kryptolebias marmoratus]
MRFLNLKYKRKTENLSSFVCLLQNAPAKGEDQTDGSMFNPEVIPGPEPDYKISIVHGDIAVLNDSLKNADPCTAKGCKWPKTGKYVYVPYIISSAYSQEERNIILGGMESFHLSTCIRFVPRTSDDQGYIYFESKDRCWSFVGRQGEKQYLSLQKNDCLYHRTVQHELLHALGFHHEQCRSDRDKYVWIYTKNVEPGQERNFDKVPTNNLGTPYDFYSVMQYSKYAFSMNGQPTIVARADPNFDWGRAKHMSSNDIARINKLYECK